MKKNMVRAALSLLMLTVSTASVHAQWMQTNWPTSSNFFDLYISQNRVFARTWDSLNGGRMFATADSGANWVQISSADSNIDILSVVALNNNIIAGTWNGFFQSTYGGTSWNTVTPAGIPADIAIRSIAMITTTLYAGTMGDIYKSSDSGTTWTEVKSGIPAEARITSFVADGNAIFAGSDTSGIFMTANDGTSWTAINSGLTDRHISQLAVMGTRLFAVTLGGVFISDNNGTSWAADSSNLKDINCFIVVSDRIFAGTDSSGVYRSDDSGATWASASSGLPAGTRVWSLAASSDNLFAGTSSGVWRILYSSIASVRKTESFFRTARSGLQFMQNGSHATVEFALAGPETVNFDVYDLSGNRIKSLVHERFCAGPQCLSFNAGSIAPGSYIIRLIAGRAVYQQTVLILR